MSTDHDLEAKVLEFYDEQVSGRGQAPTRMSDAKNAIRKRVVDLIRGTERDLDREAAGLLDRVINPARQTRSRSLRVNLERILGGFTEDGDYVDPILDLAFPLGDVAGHDKALRYWTVEDFRNVIITRYRGALEAHKAAGDLDEAAQRAITAMERRKVALFGDCFLHEEDAA